MRNLLLLVLFHLSISVYATNYYVSSSTGNDSNDGLTEQTAWQTIAKTVSMSNSFVPGDVIAFKAGDTWTGERYYTANHPSGIAGNPITYTSYGSGDKPIITLLIDQTPTWNNEGGNIWSTTQNTRARTFKNRVELLMASSLAQLQNPIYGTGWWRDAAGTLYVYSTTDPSLDTYSWANSNYTFYTDDAAYITFDNLDIQSGWTASLRATNMDNLTVVNCNIGKNSAHGIAAHESDNAFIDNNVFDADFTVDMSNLPEDGSDHRAVSDGIAVWQGCNDWIISNNYFKNWGHTAINISSGYIAIRTTNIKVYNNEMTTPDILYGRGLTYEGYVEDCEAYNNYIHDTAAPNQLGGSRNHTHHNIIADVIAPVMKAGNIAGSAIYLQNYYRGVVDNIIENNVLINTEGYGIFMESTTGDIGDVTGNIIRNNILFNTGTGLSNVAIRFVENVGEDIYDNLFQNNLVYNSATTLTCQYRSGATIYNTSDFNNQNVDISNTIGGNPLFVDPQSDWHLKSNSPAIDMVSEILAKFDYEGKIIGSKPDIGIYEMNGEGNGTGSVIANAGSDVAICLGESTILTASGGSSYVWSTGATTASITVSPSTTQTYTVTASDVSGNTDTDDVIVTVNSVTANAGVDKTITEGDSVTLTASGGDSYSWNTGDTGSSITVTPTSTSDYTVTVTKNGCSDTDSVKVIVNPTTGSVNANAGSDVAICNGGSTLLTASGGASYTWNTGATTASITVSPNTTQTYTVTASDVNGNSDTDDVIVTVNNVTANAGSDVTISDGESATLTALGGDTYLWSNGATTNNITVNPSQTQNYTVTATKNGCEDTDSVTITVNPASSVTANAGSDVAICTGESTTLTASGGFSYVWSTGETTKSVSVSPSTTQTYSVTASDVNGNSDKDDVIVTVNSVTASAGSDKTITVGQNVKLTASGGDTYLWSTGETNKSITVSPSTTTNYNVTVYQNGCNDKDEVKVNVTSEITNSPPADAFAGDDISICLGDSVTLNASGGDTYTWSTGDANSNIDVNPTRTTTYTLSAVRGGTTDTDTVTVSVENCNISVLPEDALVNELSIYPNPTTGLLNINVHNIASDMNVELISLNGSLVYKETMYKQNNGFYEIDLSRRLAKGVYFVRIFNTDQYFVEKIILN